MTQECFHVSPGIRPAAVTGYHSGFGMQVGNDVQDFFKNGLHVSASLKHLDDSSGPTHGTHLNEGSFLRH